MNIQFLFVLFCVLGFAKGSCFKAAEPNSTWIFNAQHHGEDIRNVTSFEHCFDLFTDKLSSIGMTYQVIDNTNSTYNNHLRIVKHIKKKMIC